MAGAPANDNVGAADAGFDYSASAEVFMMRARGRSTDYRRFPTAAEAIRFAVEQVPASMLAGAVMEVSEQRFDHKAIRALYARDDYPLARVRLDG